MKYRNYTFRICSLSLPNFCGLFSKRQSIGNHTNVASALGGTFEFFGEKEAHFVDKPKKESYIPGEPHPTNNLLNVPLVFIQKRQIV